jgi:hypothetical protein
MYWATSLSTGGMTVAKHVYVWHHGEICIHTRNPVISQRLIHPLLVHVNRRRKVTWLLGGADT